MMARLQSLFHDLWWQIRVRWFRSQLSVGWRFEDFRFRLGGARIGITPTAARGEGW